MRLVSRFTLLELLTVAAILMILAAIAIPMVADMQLRAKEAEVMPNGDAIVTAMIAYQMGTDNDTPIGGAQPAAAPIRQRQPFIKTGVYQAIDWQPDGEVYGINYTTTVGLLLTSTGLCEFTNFSGVNARNSGGYPPQPIYVTVAQDLDGDGKWVDTTCCESVPGTDRQVDARGRCGKNAATYTGVGLYGGDW